MPGTLDGKRAKHKSNFQVWTGAVLVAILALAGCNKGKQETPAPNQAAANQPTVQPIPHAHIFPEVSAAPEEIAAALKTAQHEHKRVLLDFGGDWCGDCQVLNVYFHQPDNQPLLTQHFVLVDVNVGRHIDENLDLGAKYGVDLKRGVPSLAVLDPAGHPIYGQSGEFSKMRHMESSSVHDFLERWQ